MWYSSGHILVLFMGIYVTSYPHFLEKSVGELLDFPLEQINSCIDLVISVCCGEWSREWFRCLVYPSDHAQDGDGSELSLPSFTPADSLQEDPQVLWSNLDSLEFSSMTHCR